MLEARRPVSLRAGIRSEKIHAEIVRASMRFDLRQEGFEAALDDLRLVQLQPSARSGEPCFEGLTETERYGHRGRPPARPSSVLQYHDTTASAVALTRQISDAGAAVR